MYLFLVIVEDSFHLCLVSDMAGLICKNHVFISKCSPVSARMIGGYGEHGGPAHLVLPETKVDIGKREVVVFGGNGEVTYVDSAMAPFPSIR